MRPAGKLGVASGSRRADVVSALTAEIELQDRVAVRVGMFLSGIVRAPSRHGQPNNQMSVTVRTGASSASRCQRVGGPERGAGRDA